MKKYISPEMEVIELEVKDRILTVSNPYGIYEEESDDSFIY